MKKILFSRDSECIQPLRELIEEQTHRVLVLWAFTCAERFLDIFEQNYPMDKRPREALMMADKWARGEVKMPVAKKAIHACHNAATDINENPVAQAAARAIGHAAGTVHVETHALGVVFYGLTSLTYEIGIAHTSVVTEKELKWFYDQLLFWIENTEKEQRNWAPFLLRDGVPNKEKSLRKKQQVK